MTGDDLLNDLEGACQYTLQQIRRLRLAKRELQVLRENGFQYTPSRIRKAEEEAERLDRNLAKVTDELMEYSLHVSGKHDHKGHQPTLNRVAAKRGD